MGFIQGMTFGQFQILAHGCPVKIWQRLVDADYQGEDDQTMEEFTQELKHDIEHLPAASNSDVDVSDRSERLKRRVKERLKRRIREKSISAASGLITKQSSHL